MHARPSASCTTAIASDGSRHRISHGSWPTRTRARRLTGAAGLRNLIVHEYADLEVDRVVQVIENDLDDLRRFVASLRADQSSR